MVVLTRAASMTVAERVKRDPAFARALLVEAATQMLNGESKTARLVLRKVVESTISWETLAEQLHMPKERILRMLSCNGNPSMANLAAIFFAVQQELRLTLSVQVVEQA